MRGWYWAMALAAGVVGALGCSEDPPGGSGASNSAGSGGGSSSSSSASGGASEYGRCAVACNAAADCCAGAPGCPGAFPDNPTCEQGACIPGQCATKNECEMLSPTLDCFRFEARHSCSVACTTDADCTAPTKCTGVDLDNKKFCKGEAVPCTSDAECNGNGLCQDGNCGACKASTDCPMSKSCVF